MPTVKIPQDPTTGSSTQSNSFEESDYPYESSYSDFAGSEDPEFGDDEDDVGPSDSASASNEGFPYHARGAPRRNHRVVPVGHWRDQHTPAAAHSPYPPPNVDHDAEYRGPWARGPPGHQQQQGAYYNGAATAGGRPYPNHAPYNMGAYANNGVVPFAAQPYGGHLLAHQGHPNGANYFNGDARGYEMMHYGGNPAAFYGDPRQYTMPASVQQYQMQIPSPSEHPGQSVTPVAKDDPEKIRLEAELKALKALEEKAKQAEKQRELEAQIRKDAEEAFQRRMDDMRRAQEQARQEIENAKAEAERAARARIEAEKKAEEERAKQQAEALKRAEENARIRFEADQKALEEKRRIEEEQRQKAEEMARIRLEAAIRAETAAKAAAEKKAAEEAARIKQIEEDAKRKAEADAAAKIEKEKADAAAKAAAEEQAKKDQEALKAKWQEEARLKLEDAAKKQTEKAPIRFKDAVGRKFSFPFHICQTWAGMEDLIKQAFLQVDVLGPHVQEGHYDLLGPDGETILPSVWEKIIQPDWSISMMMWPLDKNPLMGPGGRGGMRGGMRGGIHGGMHGGMRGGIPPPPIGRNGIPLNVPPPPRWEQPPRHGKRHGIPHGVDVINAAPSSKPKKKKDDNFFKFFAGAPTKSKKKSSSSKK